MKDFTFVIINSLQSGSWSSPAQEVPRFRFLITLEYAEEELIIILLSSCQMDFLCHTVPQLPVTGLLTLFTVQLLRFLPTLGQQTEKGGTYRNLDFINMKSKEEEATVPPTVFD